MIYETEVERVLYLLRSYLRTRIQKIQKQALHLARDAEAQGRMSASENAFAGKYAALYQRQVDREAWSVGDTSRLRHVAEHAAVGEALRGAGLPRCLRVLFERGK